MANNQKKQNGNRTRRLQTTDFSISLTGKHVFGAYFNMARTNFIKIINYILPIAGISGKYSENQIDKMLRALFLIHANRIDELTPEQQQWKRKLTMTEDQQMRLHHLLFKHFPVLRPIMADFADHKVYSNKKKSKVNTDDEAYALMKGISLTDCLEMVALMGLTLTECRNFYTHKDPYNEPSQLAEQFRHQDTIAKKLDKVVVASRRILKDREGLSVNELEFLTGIDHMEQVDMKDENGNVKKKNGKTLKAFKEYDDFYFKITGKRRVEGLTMAGGNAVNALLPALSDFGLLYFCVLFLSKSYAKFFIEEARLFEFSPFSEKDNYIMREMLSIYRIRMPRLHRIDSRDDKATLAMDIFAELRRCPIELYDKLDKKVGQPFFHDTVKNTNDYTPEVSKRLRYKDRFPQLALQYIDETELFKRIRFQLQLGSFRYRFYDKNNCIDGRTRVRRIQKDINGYGRLKEVDEKRFEVWGDLIQKREERPVKLEHEDIYIDLDQFQQDTAESTPYITDRRPAYNIHAHRIGLYWEQSQDTRKYKVFDKQNIYLPILTVTDDKKAPVLMPAPRCTLSTYDLPAMLFYEYLRSQQNEKTISSEQIIINCVEDFKKFFLSVADGTLKPFSNTKAFRDYLEENYPNLHRTDIPDKIVKYLTGQKLFYNNKQVSVRERLIYLTLEHLDEREQRVSKRLEHYKADLNKIGEKDNKYGKKDYADVRHGTLARYLAKSMMEWQPSKDGEGHDKLTGLNYNVLTAYLSTYGSQKPTEEENFQPRTLNSVLKEAHLTEGCNPHPFINKVLNYSNRTIEELYLNYLQEELKHIRSRKQSLKDNPSDKALATLPFVHHQRLRFHERTDEEIRALASRYTTVQLPDGLFTHYIVDILKNNYSDNKLLQTALKNDMPAKLDPTLNAGYLISLFYQTVQKDDAQPYYLSNKLYTKENENGKKVTYSFKRAYEPLTILNNNKKSTFPFELIPLYLTSDEIQQRVSEKLLNDEGQPIPVPGKRGKPARDTQQNIIWQRKINQAIIDYAYSQSDKDLKVSYKQPKREQQEERESKRIALIERLKREIKEVKETERSLRRYKTQDMVLFLLAKDMFIKILGEQNHEVDKEHLRLSEVCNDAFLRQTLTFRIPVTIGNNTIYVEQENMSLKNYGEFYRFLNDERLTSLIDNIIDNTTPDKDGHVIIRHADLMSELASYDHNRATVFMLIQQIENLIIENNIELKNPDEPGFWASDTLPKRNNFKSLLKLVNELNDKPLNDDERALIVAIRNAFSHNSYNINLSLIKDVKHLPEVANVILRHLKKLLGVQTN